MGQQRRNLVRVLQQNLSELKPTDSYAITALMTRIEGWERTRRAIAFRSTTTALSQKIKVLGRNVERWNN